MKIGRRVECETGGIKAPVVVVCVTKIVLVHHAQQVVRRRLLKLEV